MEQITDLKVLYPSLKIIIVTIASALYTYFLIFNFLPIFRKYSLIYPNERSIHKNPTPSGIGIIFAKVGIISSIICNNYLPLICLPISIMGLIDDISNMPIKRRFIIHCLTILTVMGFSSLNSYLLNTFNLLIYIIIFFIVFLIGISAINFVNFADGSDGLLGGCMLIIFTTTALFYDASIWPFVGIMSIFLKFNWHPAKLFMGDAGSTFLGGIFVTILLNSENLNAFFSILLLGTPIFSDTCFCVIRRLLSGQHIFKPHRLHLFQRLHLAGVNQRIIALSYGIASIIISLSLLTGGLKAEFIVSIIVVIVAFIIDKKFAKKFSLIN